MSSTQRGKLAAAVSPVPMAGISLALFAVLIWWSWEYPRLVASGANPPSLLGPVLVATAVSLLIAALVRAITRRSSSTR